MRTDTSSDRITRIALGIAWSLWTELGISGWEQRPPTEAIDLEPLILFTSWLGALDHRLLDECLDWCVTNARFASATRLRSLMKRAEPEVVQAFGDFSATVRSKVPKINWPGQGRVREFTPSRKSQIPQLERAALIQLRLRALFGVSARAEVLRLLLIQPPRAWSAADLARESAYAKVNVASTLDLLVLADAVAVKRSGRQFRYRIERGAQLAEFVGGAPAFQPDWTARFSVVLELIRMARDPSTGEGRTGAANRVAVLRRIAEALDRLGLAGTTPVPGGADFAAAFDHWAEQLLGYWAAVDSEGGPEEATFEVRRGDIGWKATVREPGYPPRPMTLPDWDELYKEAPRSDTMISDDSSGSLQLAHELMRRASARAGDAIEPFRYQPEVMAFAQEQLRSIRTGHSRTFTEGFLRLWRSERLARIGLRQ
jgi:hypothetical protein